MDDGSASEHQSSPDRTTTHKAESDGGRRTPDTTPTRRRKLGGGSSGHGGGSLSLDSVHSMREGKGIALGASRAVGGVEKVTTQRGGAGEGM